MAFTEDLHFAMVRGFGRSFKFLLNNPQDYVQQHLSRGTFYEAEELDLICSAASASGCKRLLDIGANVGTHSIYLAHRMNLERVTPIECNRVILHILMANLGLNWHPSFDFKHLGKGLASRSGLGSMEAFNPLNIGATRFREGVSAAPDEISVPMVAGDDLFLPGEFDFIKMDIEGMELLALSGMRRLLTNFKGVLFIEVQNENSVAFAQYVNEMGFEEVGRYRRYKACANWLLRGRA